MPSMQLLLDSHALLWALSEWQQLLPKALEKVRSTENVVYFSPVSIWELEIKAVKGLLELQENLAMEAIVVGFMELPIRSAHARRAAHLPAHHRDPFDRMLIAQALEEGLTVVTRDLTIPLYGVPVLKC